MPPLQPSSTPRSRHDPRPINHLVTRWMVSGRVATEKARVAVFQEDIRQAEGQHFPREPHRLAIGAIDAAPVVRSVTPTQLFSVVFETYLAESIASRAQSRPY